MDSLTFLEDPGAAKLQPVYVLAGDEDFLKRQVVLALRKLVFGPDGDEFGLSTHAGDKATFAAVFDELETTPFLTPRRLVIVETADPFVTRNRPALEKYMAKPSMTGVLVLDVRSWAGTTKLAKLVPNMGTLVCKGPPPYKLPEWCTHWCKSRHGKQLAGPGARLLVDLVGADMGQLDQELTKLAIYVGAATRIESADVDKLVGCSRNADIFKIFGAIANGRPGEALGILDRLFEQGEEPIRILGAFRFQMSRLVKVSRLIEQGRPPAVAMEEAGLQSFARQDCEQQLRHLGPRRINRLYDWLLETDLGLKGASQLPPETLLERLLVQLCQPAAGSKIRAKGT